jgi:ATP-dependent DNA helicase Rep/DNA helicase-2/ATP-dependent DNA helicase PcrA
LRYFRIDNGSPIKRTRLTEWLTDAARWCAGGWQTGSASLSQLLKAWRRLRRSVTRESELLAARKRLIAALFSLRDGALPLHRWLSALRRDVLDDLLQQEAGLAEEEGNLDELIAAAAAGGPLQTFTVQIFGNQGKSPDQINLMTLHSSKGLEFQAAIMVGLENGVFPSGYDKTVEQLEEVARLFYVGVTRAKTQIHLTYDEDESPLVTSIREVGWMCGPIQAGYRREEPDQPIFLFLSSVDRPRKTVGRPKCGQGRSAIGCGPPPPERTPSRSPPSPGMSRMR